jgi:hypothetical protein
MVDESTANPETNPRARVFGYLLNRMSSALQSLSLFKFTESSFGIYIQGQELQRWGSTPMNLSTK